MDERMRFIKRERVKYQKRIRVINRNKRGLNE